MDALELLQENARLRGELAELRKAFSGEELRALRRLVAGGAEMAPMLQQGRDAAHEAARLRRLAAGLSMELQAALTALRVGDDARYLEANDGE